MRTLIAAVALAAGITLFTAPGALAQSPAPSATASPAATASPVADITVHIHGSAFVPAKLTIRAGESVRFVNDDDVEHDVTATGGEFASPELDRGESYTFTFATPGAFAYGCNDHAFMHGTIVVLAN